MDKLNIPKLNGTYYFMQCLIIKAASSLRMLVSVISEVKAEGQSDKDSIECDQKNSDAVPNIKLSLSDEQTLQLAAEEKSESIMKQNKIIFYRPSRKYKNRPRHLLKNLEIKLNESASDYIARDI